MIDPDETRGTDRETTTKDTPAAPQERVEQVSVSTPRRGSDEWRTWMVAKLARQLRCESRRWRARRRGRATP